MTRAINLYSLSRIHEEAPFNALDKHMSQKETLPRTKSHEIESLRFLTDQLLRCGVSLREVDGFFYGFNIPQIGKEFDLLRFTDKICLNIELKSIPVSAEQMLNQLLKNRYYLRHLGKRLLLYTVITSTMKCYKLSMNDELVAVEFDELARAVRQTAADCEWDIDSKFRVSQYLVSPLNAPERFIQGEYFLTQAQARIKKEMLSNMDEVLFGAFFHLTGRPGTGKTLLLYDVAKTLSKSGKTLVIHCGNISSGQIKISDAVENLRIVSAQAILQEGFSLAQYSFLLVDESHRIHQQPFAAICRSVMENDQICIFSSDPEQVLSYAERERDIVAAIRLLPLDGEYTLSEKIRSNQALHSFITCMLDLNHRPRTPMNYQDVQLNYANTTGEAQELLDYYREKGFIFINYTKSSLAQSPYAIYEEDYDTHHVIGQEFDKVVMLMDGSFYYDEEDKLQAAPQPGSDYLYPNLFYQGVTRAREKLAVIVVQAPALFEKVLSILQ